MSKLALLVSLVLVLVGSQADCDAASPSGWFDRAPLNTDDALVGISGEARFGVGQAYRYLAFLLNFPVLAGFLYLLAKTEVDYTHYIEVYLGVLIGSFLLGLLLNPVLRIFSVVPIIMFITFLLARFCAVRPSRALAAALLYQVYQVGYLLAYRAIAGNYT